MECMVLVFMWCDDVSCVTGIKCINQHFLYVLYPFYWLIQLQTQHLLPPLLQPLLKPRPQHRHQPLLRLQPLLQPQPLLQLRPQLQLTLTKLCPMGKTCSLGSFELFRSHWHQHTFPLSVLLIYVALIYSWGLIAVKMHWSIKDQFNLNINERVDVVYLSPEYLHGLKTSL